MTDLSEKLEELIDKKIESALPKPNQGKAIVLETDIDGTVWVRFDGGADRTPVNSYGVSFASGDEVLVRIDDGGRAYIDTNYSNPGAGVTQVQIVEKNVADVSDKADTALQSADAAEKAAISAIESAEEASEAASSAIESAEEAASAAASAQQSATEADDKATDALASAITADYNANIAKQNASQANAYAIGALGSLSDVEKVVGTLNWITEHGVWSETLDEHVEPGKQYYTFDDDDYSPVQNPTDDDMFSYSLTSDVEIDPEKTYYEKITEYTYEPTTDESFIEGKTYYVYDEEEETFVVAKISEEDTGTFVEASGYDISELTVHGETRQWFNLFGSPMEGYLTGTETTYMQINKNNGGTVFVAQIEPNTIYTVSAKYYSEMTRFRVDLFNADPSDGTQFESGNYTQIKYVANPKINQTLTFDSGQWTWIALGLSTGSSEFDPDAEAQLEVGSKMSSGPQEELQVVTGNNILDDENRSYDDGPRTTSKGVTIEYEGNGWWHLYGTVTGTGNGVLSAYGHETDQTLFLAGPGTYTFSMEAYGTPWGVDILRAQCMKDSTSTYVYGSVSFATVTAETAVKLVRFYIPGAATGAVIDTHVRLQLEPGNIAHRYSPHNAIGVCSMSKNLLPLLIPAVRNGVTATIDRSTGEIMLDGTTTAASRFSMTLGGQFPPGAYILSANNTVANGDVVLTIGMEGVPSAFTVALDEPNKELSVVTEVPISSWSIYMANNKTADSFKLSPQLEFGDVVTEYELHRELVSFIKPPAGYGDLELASLPDGTCDTLTVDSAGHCVLEKVCMYADWNTPGWTGTTSTNSAGLSYVKLTVPLTTTTDYPYAPQHCMSNYEISSVNFANAQNEGFGLYGTSLYYRYDPGNQTPGVEAGLARMAELGAYIYIGIRDSQTSDLGYIDLPGISEDGSLVSAFASFTPTIDVEWLIAPTDEQFANYCDRFEHISYLPVEEPILADLPTYYERTVLYYELSIDVSVQNYIANHLSLTNDGLNLTADSSKYRAVLATDGLRILDPQGNVVGVHGEEVQLGSTSGIYFSATSNILSFRTVDQLIAWFGQNSDGIWEMHIQNTYAEDMVRFGDYAFIKRQNGNMSLKWLGDS